MSEESRDLSQGEDAPMRRAAWVIAACRGPDYDPFEGLNLNLTEPPGLTQFKDWFQNEMDPAIPSELMPRVEKGEISFLDFVERVWDAYQFGF